MESVKNQRQNSRVNTVSLVDDDMVSNLLTSSTIQKSGLVNHVVTYDSAREALKEISKLSSSDPGSLPEVIFLDISMPVMDGLEFLDEFDKLQLPLPAKCKVYMLSSSIDFSDIQRAKSHSTVYDFISKPLTVNKLQSIFTQWGYA